MIHVYCTTRHIWTSLGLVKGNKGGIYPPSFYSCLSFSDISSWIKILVGHATPNPIIQNTFTTNRNCPLCCIAFLKVFVKHTLISRTKRITVQGKVIAKIITLYLGSYEGTANNHDNNQPYRKKTRPSLGSRLLVHPHLPRLTLYQCQYCQTAQNATTSSQGQPERSARVTVGWRLCTNLTSTICQVDV